MRMPETSPLPDLSDRRALSLHRARADRMAEPAWFLHDHVTDHVEERLNEVNKTFCDVAVVGGAVTHLQSLWPNAVCVSDEETLDLEEGAFDLVLHSLSLHWANDPVGQLVQVRRALKPDGLMIATTFGGRTLHELRASLAQAESQVLGGLSPRVAPMGEIRDYGSLLQRAGFALPVADSLTLDVDYESALHLMHDLRAMGETNALAARSRHFTRRAVMSEADRIYAEQFSSSSSRVRATFEIVFLTGWAPSDNQQKPLRPGSAEARLADALGVDETSAGEKPRPDKV